MIRNANYSQVYVWDTLHASELPPAERGNSISIPVDFEFRYIYDPTLRLRWMDRKTGSPSFGQVRTQPTAFLKPEAGVNAPPAAADVRGASDYANLLKVFKGWGPIGFTLYQQVRGLSQGARYAFKLPVFADLVMTYTSGLQKIFADDPAAGLFSARIEDGAVDFIPDPPDETTWDSWYDGNDIEFGKWFSLERVFDATQATMTVGGEFYSTFGLVNSGFFFGPPSLQLIGSPGPAGDPTLPSLVGLVIDEVNVTYRRPATG